MTTLKTDPETPADAPSSSDVEKGSGRRPWRLIFFGAVAVLLAIFIATQVIGILFAIVFPPSAPVPPNSTIISHTSEAHGVDDWLYGTDASGCEVLFFYQQHGVCRFAPMTCEPGGSAGGQGAGQNTGRCTGEVYFSIFAMRWNVSVATGYSENGATHFRLTREIFWTGVVPPRTMDEID